MSVPDRTGGAGPVGGASAGSRTAGPPVPPAGAALDASPPAPAGPRSTAGAVDARAAAPAVTHGWATALTGLCAHWVPEGGPRAVHYGRPTGLTLEGYDALIDPLGLEQGAELPKCPECLRRLQGWTPPESGHRS